MIDYSIPLIGFCAYSGTGKTTLLTKLIPLLKAQGLRIGVVKHAHHQFDIDQPGKDSFKLRKAGAEQMLIASRKQMACIKDFPEERDEPDLTEALQAFQPGTLDIILVEGFKHEAFTKIELHRPSRGRPLIYPTDKSVIAIATDAEIPEDPHQPTRLDINNPDGICQFILEWLSNKQIPSDQRTEAGG